MTPELTKTESDEQDSRVETQKRSFNGDPKTDSDSKTVAIAGERHDTIEITNVVERFEPEAPIPAELSVIRREQRFYGPELLLHSEINETNQNFLLTAPGPTDQLRLWAAQRIDENRRSGWTAVADIQAALSVEQPPYEVCEQCGEEIRTIEHERMSVLGRCQR
jgi:hypothetical protein